MSPFVNSTVTLRYSNLPSATAVVHRDCSCRKLASNVVSKVFGITDVTSIELKASVVKPSKSAVPLKLPNVSLAALLNTQI